MPASRASFSALVFVMAGCGGGGGTYYPPRVEIDSTKLVRQEFSVPDDFHSSSIVAQTREIEKQFDTLDVYDMKRDAIEDRIEIDGETYWRRYDFEYTGAKYSVRTPIDKWVSIFDTWGSEIKRLALPRYSKNAVAFPIKTKAQTYLIVYVNQQTTSHSSTLFVLNDLFEIVYQEHFLGARWIGRISGPDSDSFLVVSENRWRPNGTWETIGGPWYYSFGGTK